MEPVCTVDSLASSPRANMISDDLLSRETLRLKKITHFFTLYVYIYTDTYIFGKEEVPSADQQVIYKHLQEEEQNKRRKGKIKKRQKETIRNKI